MEVKKIVALIVAIISAANMILDAFGMPPIPLEEGTIYTIASAVVMLISWASTIWLNFNFTDASKAGQSVINKIKDGLITADEAVMAVEQACADDEGRDDEGCDENVEA